ncbi:unnamed protein product [Cochlearia groenlandica]
MEKEDDYYSGGASPACLSPSFSTYSGDSLAVIAERVGQKFADEKGGDEESEFEFSTAAYPHGNEGGFAFPVFDRNLVTDSTVVKLNGKSTESVVTPLKDLFLLERNEESTNQTYPSSSSDDEEEELDEIPSEIYCPWTPDRSAAAEMSPNGGCRKSKSTGSSSTRRWRIRDLLKRSHSDGKQSLKFLNQNSINSNNRDESSSKKKKKEKVLASSVSLVSAHEKFYLRNKAMKEEDKRKSYLPYKKDLVGLFSNVKAFPPF